MERGEGEEIRGSAGAYCTAFLAPTDAFESRGIAHKVNDGRGVRGVGQTNILPLFDVLLAV